MDKGKLVVKTLLQDAVDMTDIISRVIAMVIVMRCETWLHSLGFTREAQNTLEDLPFDKFNLFNEKTDKSLH